MAAIHPEESKREILPDKRENGKRIVVLISGNGSNLQALIDKIHNGSEPVSIVAVFSNIANAFGLQRAKNADIDTQTINHKDFASRAVFDDELQQKIDQYEPDLIVLAGFMRILTPAFVNHYQGRMLNIHPSLLPKYQGLHTHQRVIVAGDKIHGASVHFVTEELDGGPTILQAEVPVLAGDTPESLASRVLVQEHLIYPEAVRWFCSDRLQLKDGAAFFEKQILPCHGLRINNITR